VKDIVRIEHLPLQEYDNENDLPVMKLCLNHLNVEGILLVLVYITGRVISPD
jgi:hypothetical protein